MVTFKLKYDYIYKYTRQIRPFSTFEEEYLSKIHTNDLELYQQRQFKSKTDRILEILRILNAAGSRDDFFSTQRHLELLDFITNNDVQRLRRNLTPEEEEFALKTMTLLFPKNVYYWWNLNLKRLDNGDVFNIKDKYKTTHRFQEIFEFFQNIKITHEEPLLPLIIIYCVKSLMKTLFVGNRDSTVKKAKFLSVLIKNVFKYTYACTVNKSYFKIISNNPVLMSFATTVFGLLIEQYPGLKVVRMQENEKTVDYFALSNPNENTRTQGIKALTNHNLPMVCAPKPWVRTGESSWNFGGFICNKLLHYPAVHLRSGSGNTALEPIVIECIDYIQNNIYRVPYYQGRVDDFDLEAIFQKLYEYISTIFSVLIFEIVDGRVILKPYAQVREYMTAEDYTDQ